MLRRLLVSLFLTLALLSPAASFAGAPSLLRVERRSAGDRDDLLRQGVPLVLEHERFFLVLGDADNVSAALRALGRDALVVDSDIRGWTYWGVGLRPGSSPGDLAACGDVVLTEDSWALMRSIAELPAPCIESHRWHIARLAMQTLRLSQPPPAEYAHLQGAVQAPHAPKPLVAAIMSGVTDTMIAGNWDQIINAASTRNSTSAGCFTAAQVVADKLTALGLTVTTQTHHATQAPNVIGTKLGLTDPSKVYIVIGHLDDAPSTGSAPGADDNASGSVAVTTAAQAMAAYEFAYTVKFIVVTGEEQGLFGSTYYADNALASGEQIQAVLNADMIAWQGDTPGTENLDLNYNSTSQWLGTLFAQCATDYATGCVVDAFSCPSLTASDHAPFWDDGYSAVCGITDNEGYCSHGGSYPYYHTSNDTKANCGATAFFYGAVKAYVATLAHLADPLCARPSTPGSASASPAGDNHVTVSWGSAGAGVTYEVWRAPGGCSGSYPASKLGETSALSWEDTTASGGILYAYRVRSRLSSCVSGFSSCAEVSTTGACQEPPSFTGAASVSNPAAATCALDVTWPVATVWCGGPVAYSVYRSTTSPFVPATGNRIASGLAGSPYSDAANLVSGTTYYYAVRASDAATGIEDANTTSVSAAPTGPPTHPAWTDNAGDTGSAAFTGQSPWSVGTTAGRNGTKGYLTGTYTNNLCSSLTMTGTVALYAGATLSFWSTYDLESGWDKGQVDVSQDGGTTWARVPVNYPTSSTRTGDACGLPNGQTYFTGANATWTQYTASLATWANQTVKLRFRLSSDYSEVGAGWTVDDIAISYPATSCTTGSSCTVSCSATVPADVEVGVAAAFQSDATLTTCAGTASYAWTFGDSATSAQQNPTHAYASPGSYPWSVTVSADGKSCTKNGTILVTMALTPAALAVDGTAGIGPSNLNGVFEPGESVVVVPTWHNGSAGPGTVTSTASGFGGPAGPTYTISDSAATYGSIAAATDGSCAATGNCFGLAVSAPTTRPATHWDATFTESIAALGAKAWTLHVGGSFTDVPASATPGSFYHLIETLLHSGTTAGCTVTTYCPTSDVTRAQMAMFLARAANSGNDAAVPATGTVPGRGDYDCSATGTSQFADVAPTAQYCRHVHYLAVHGITQGCDTSNFCPTAKVTRASMAMFVARAMAGGDGSVPASYTDTGSGRSYDCATASPSTYFTDVTAALGYCRHAHYLWARSVVDGCTTNPTPQYCPASLVRRDQMAKFLVNAFSLKLYTP